jgi:uncharacterized protein (TIGR00251 family)
VSAPFVQQKADGIYLAIKLQPRASRQQIVGVQGNELKISVTAPPVDSTANQALVEFLCEVLQASRSQVTLVRGQTSRHKTIRVTGMAVDELVLRLQH